MKADVKQDIKTRERIKDVSAEDEKVGDASSARVDDDPTNELNQLLQ